MHPTDQDIINNFVSGGCVKITTQGYRDEIKVWAVLLLPLDLHGLLSTVYIKKTEPFQIQISYNVLLVGI